MSESFYEYMLEGYPRGQDYGTSVTGWYRQLHDTSKDEGGNYIGKGADGKLDLHPRFMGELDGVPHAVVKQAVEELRAADRMRIAGSLMVRALEFYQYSELNKIRGITEFDVCQELSVSRTTLKRWRDEAISLIEALVFKRGHA